MNLISPSSIWAMELAAFQRMFHWMQFAVEHLSIDAAALPKPKEYQWRQMDNLAVIDIKGVIDKYPSSFLSMFGDFVSVIAVRQAVEQAVAEPKIETILLVIDSPGGSVDGLAELGDALFAARQKKPLVAQVDGMAASAAFYIASQAHEIFAHRMDMVGSIGTRLMLYDWHKNFEEDGIEAVPIDTGTFKSAGALGTEITKEQRADFQRIVDAYQDDFLNVIRRGRTITEAKLTEVADGRVFIGQEALNHGLIDGIQTFDQTVGILHQEPPKSAPRRTRARLALRQAEEN